MTRIMYFQRTSPLAEMGIILQAHALPQDESSAVVGLAALLTRHYANRWPGEYSAVIDPEDGTRPTVITEEDPRVITAAAMLAAIARHRDYTTSEMTRVRNAIAHRHQP
jgi:hypothetical protein